MSHPVVFAEIHGADGAALRRFYAGLFGWPFQEMPGADYGMAPPEAGGIGVGVGAAPEGRPGLVTSTSEPTTSRPRSQPPKASGARRRCPRRACRTARSSACSPTRRGTSSAS